MIQINGFKNVNIINSNIFSVNEFYADDLISFFNDQQDVTVDIINSVIYAEHILKYNVFSKSVNVSLNNVTLSTTLAILKTSHSPFLAVDSLEYETGTIQESWISPVYSTPTASAYSDFNYLKSNLGITVSGDTDYKTDGLEWFSGQRDGIGSFYFEKPDNVLSASGSSGTIPFDISFSVSATSANTNNNEITYDFGDGNTSATTNLLITHTYNSVGTFSATAEIETKNEWYKLITSATKITSYSGTLSASYNIHNLSTSAVITSANTYQDLFLSGDILGGSPNLYDINFIDDNYESQNVIDSLIYYPYKFKTPGTKNITLKLYDSPDTFSVSAAFIVSELPSTTYYVDISETYDTNTSNIGTSADPFNYLEFYDYIKTDGSASATDIFKLRGYRELTKPTSATSPWTAIETDSDKKITIESWDLSAYGPWLLIINDYSVYDSTIVSFKSSILKNGIIYNKPFNLNNTDYGGTYYLSYAYNMYLVQQGLNSTIKVYPNISVSGVDVEGCTIYSENGFSDLNTFSAYNFKITDSVITGFTSSASTSSFLSANCYLYNDTFRETSAYIDSYFILSANENCQFGWSLPTDYPFLKGDSGYNQTLSWLLMNKEILVPFSGITTPPNPGKNYDIYKNYETGLFGYSRKDYVR